ncbi:MAG: choice-of-anchor B family protein [Bacteroidota bacterium]
MKKLLLSFYALAMVITANSQSLNLIGHMSYTGTCAGVWDYVDSLNNEYAIVGVSDKVSIVDVTNPAAPVERFSVPALSGQTSLWRELKTWNKHAYAVSEGGGGVICIDLSHLPDTVTYNHWYGDSAISGLIADAHTIAATDGYIYVFGATGVSPGGCIIADISDPMNPHFTGLYTENYIHDGYIRNDTLWAGEIYLGQFSVIDVTDKSNPVLITATTTPSAFTHNVWLSDDGTHAFTTDEHTDAPLVSFNVSDLTNIQLEDIYVTDSLPSREVHNVRVLNDYLINPSYGSQLTIVDAAHPDNLIEIARAPTIFNGSNPGLCWDASPYLPSGNILVTDINGGLFIFQPDYQRACYLEGTITDSMTGVAIPNTLVEIISTVQQTQSSLAGIYKTGTGAAGTFDVTFSKTGYQPKTYTGITLSHGITTTLNAQLVAITTVAENVFTTSIEVNPNPFSNSFVLKLNAETITPSTVIQLFDVTGKMVFEQNITSPETNINLPLWIGSGLYNARINGTGKKMESIRLVKN